MKRLNILPLMVLALLGCSQQTSEPVKIAINPWPGYEFLYLAQEQGFFAAADLNVELIPFNSLSDAQRAYLHGRVDGFTGTMIEAVQSQMLSDRLLKVVLVPDYSNGGDVVVARSHIDSVAGLKDKKVGCEISSLGIYMLHRALSSAGLSLDDVELVNVEQNMASTAFQENKIEAFVTYPPVSIELLNIEGMSTLFTSAEIPLDIIDIVVVTNDVLQQNPHFVEKLYEVWQMALDFTQNQPDLAYKIMATRQGISEEDFIAAVGDLKLLSTADQREIFLQPEKLQAKARDVCDVLVQVGAIDDDCNTLPSMIYQ